MRYVKILLLVLIFIGILIPGVFGANDLRIGLEFGNPNLVGIIRYKMIDFKFGYNFRGAFKDADRNFFHLSTDIRIVDSYKLVDPLYCFFGLGAFFQINTHDGDSENVFGARFPIGLQILLFDKKFEIFGEIVPTLTIVPEFPSFHSLQGWVGFTVALPF